MPCGQCSACYRKTCRGIKAGNYTRAQLEALRLILPDQRKMRRMDHTRVVSKALRLGQLRK